MEEVTKIETTTKQDLTQAEGAIKLDVAKTEAFARALDSKVDTLELHIPTLFERIKRALIRLWLRLVG